MKILTIIVAICIIILTITEEVVAYFKLKPIMDRKNNKDINIRNNDIDSARILLEEKSVEKIDNFFDDIIKKEINNYKILSGYNEETYMNTEMTDEMLKYVFASCMNNITPAILSTIGLIYDTSDKKKIEELFKLRIKLNIIVTVINQNVPI